jgi:hypothetical protein
VADIQKVYVARDNSAVITCPNCDRVKNTQVERFRGARHVIRAKCTCGHVFSVSLEFRKSYRKEIKLAGDFVYLPQGRSGGKMTVTNVSMSGLGARVIGSHNLAPGVEIEVRFNLDDAHSSEIKKRAVVRLVNGSYIGCEFLDKDNCDKALGFYLMP